MRSDSSSSAQTPVAGADPDAIRGLGLAHFTVLETPPHELVAMAARIGYAAVGLRLHPAYPGAPFYSLPPGSDAAREVQYRLRGEGVALYDMEFVTIGPDFVASGLEPYLHSAAELGARRVSVCGDDPDLSRLADRLGEVCRLAASYGMGVDVEWMAWRAVSTLQDAVKIVQGCGEPNCALLIDALHLDRTGATPADVAALPPGLVRSVQLCDAPAARPGDMAATLLEARAGRLPPGEGALPIRDLLAAAPRDAMLSVEVPTTSSCPPEDRVRHIFESTQRLLAERVITRRAKPEDRDDRR